MKTLHFDCFAGISGDMTLGALVDLGLDPEDLRRELEKLGLPGWKLDFRREERRGINGMRAVVDLEGRRDHEAWDDGPEEPRGYHHHDHEHSGEHLHEHSRDHDRSHEHPHVHSHGHEHSGEHSHRSWRDIRDLIERSGIGDGAKRRALDIFSRVAEAESRIHGTPVEDIGFHELGALDSIIDIVGAAIGLELLKPDRITAGEVELGGGTVRCAHGILPVPAPATLILCQGLPVRTGGFDREMTTPTGAAILAASVDEFITGPRGFTEIKTGYGIGTRKMDKPNVLRVSWREERIADAGMDLIAEELILIETNIDDMSGEALGFLMERLFEGGALDVTLSPCVMKKSRPGTIVSVLCPPYNPEVLRRILLAHSTTIGFREIPIRRLSLRREAGTLAGEYGEVRTKTVFRNGQSLRTKIEFEDRARLARERDISLADAEELMKKGTPG
ncbi:MAG: nickel pincer cofactor biosynthesis protein LarC [Spirochaetaceae bacterium]|jgi:uncharacterized protein (TIGR00299 family) protein|nr:nickel pincer cofactor biosynthesis protein LarC [Spirochaetaceae bacterium]